MPAAKTATASAQNGGCGTAFIWVWLAVWSFCTVGADIFLAYSAVRQCLAYSYASADGTVVSTKIESSSDSEGGTTYTPQVHYTYSVNGRQFQADRISYLFVSSSHQAAQNVVDRFPAGQALTVYYNPASPGDSVLVRGIDGMHLFVGLFILLANFMAIGAWYAFCSQVGPGKRVRHWLHFRVRDNGLKTNLTIYTLPPLLAFGIGSGTVAFFMIFVVGLGMSILPVFWLALAGWLVVLAAGIFAWFLAFRWARVLEFDRLSGRLELSQSGAPRILSTAEVREVVVDESSTKDSEGNVKSRYSTCLVCPGNGPDAPEERIELCTWSGQDLAEWVRAWVSEKLRRDAPQGAF